MSKFHSSKRLETSDMLFPYLFIICADCGAAVMFCDLFRKPQEDRAMYGVKVSCGVLETNPLFFL